MTRVLLINPPYPGKSADVSPSLGYLGSMLKRDEVSVSIWDNQVMYSYKDKFKEVMELVKRLNPRLIGFTLTTPFVRFAYKLAGALKSEFGIPLIAGGAHATLCPQEVLEKASFDLVAIGEGEYTIVDLLKHFRGELELQDVAGIAYKDKSGNIVFTKERALISNLDELPFPLDIQSLLNDGKGGFFGQIITSRGCPARCIFCGSLVHGKKYRFRSAENVFAEMMHLNEKYKVTHFRFQDDALTINQPRLEKLCDIITQKNMQFTWNCQSRADALGLELLKKMSQAGCRMVDIGLETASPEVMKRIKKNAPLKRVLEVVEDCHALKLPVTVNLMAGFPFETKEDIRTNIEFMKSISNKVSRFNVGLVLKPYPGTEVYNLFHERYGFSQWWLNEQCALSEDIDYIPLYLSERLGAWTLPEDATLRRDFFHYSPDMKKAIKGFIWYKCWFSMKRCHGIVRSMVLLSLFYLSKLLCQIHPSLERAILLPLFYLGRRLNHMAGRLSAGIKQTVFKADRRLNRLGKAFLRSSYRVITKPDRLFKHLGNRILFLLCIPIQGFAGWPLAFYVNLNARCNLRCKMCDVGQRNTESYLYKNMAAKEELPLEQWKTIIDRIAYLKPHIDISAVEPFLYKDLIGLLEYIKKGKGLTVSLTTNGFLLERFVPGLVRAGIDCVTVSIDGPRELHDQIRGVAGSFDAALKGMQALLSYKHHPRLRINYTISNFNYAYLLQTIHSLRQTISWDRFTFIHLSFVSEGMSQRHNPQFPYYPVTSGDIAYVDLRQIDIPVLVGQIRQVKQNFGSQDVRFHPEISLNSLEIYYKKPESFILPKRCIMPWIAASILSNGEVMAFNRCPTPNFGNLRTDDFKNIWNNQDFRAFRVCLKRQGAFAMCARCGSLKMR